MANQNKKSSKKGKLGITALVLLALAGLGIYQGTGGGLLPGSGTSITQSDNQGQEGEQETKVAEVKVKEDEIYWSEPGQTEEKISQDQLQEKLQTMKDGWQIRLIDNKAIKASFDQVKKAIQDNNIEIVETVEQ
ncbi:hypothetical protein M0R79_02775 [Ignavigranum ruoffiae]|uniref:hypothetical protein n=1 Tax=Ignavigranum ruoffiae TaxID=89093 RepID=UPI00205BD865|nr:hypothetical protein [Ignavigranum ruoffiae]UPQ86319.1 hypothetical protein M0R79_02775 [Ignavigranum ruoffiae]